MKTNAIGILGGTFDPIHYGHLRAAIEVAEHFDMAQIRLIPNAEPPHREPPKLCGQERLKMINLAINQCHDLVVDDRELRREGPSYTIDTLTSLRQQFPNNALYLMVGSDAFNGIHRWHEWQNLLNFAHIVVMQRPGEHITQSTSFSQWLTPLLGVQDRDSLLLAGKIWPLTITQLAISATAIRAMISEGKSPKFLLPQAVLDYIEYKQFYKSTD